LRVAVGDPPPPPPRPAERACVAQQCMQMPFGGTLGTTPGGPDPSDPSVGPHSVGSGAGGLPRRRAGGAAGAPRPRPNGRRPAARASRPPGGPTRVEADLSDHAAHARPHPAMAAGDRESVGVWVLCPPRRAHTSDVSCAVGRATRGAGRGGRRNRLRARAVSPTRGGRRAGMSPLPVPPSKRSCSPCYQLNAARNGGVRPPRHVRHPRAADATAPQGLKRRAQR